MTLKGVRVGDEIEVTFGAIWNASRKDEVERFRVTGFSPSERVVKASAKSTAKSMNDMQKLGFFCKSGECSTYRDITAKKVTA